MLKTAFVNALRRDWGLILAVVAGGSIAQSWRQHGVSFVGVLVSLLGALVVLLLAMVPVEYQKLRNPR
jgi:uncharacterized membrane protein YeaQ/YmgE (transglycosylase-associated protein family)